MATIEGVRQRARQGGLIRAKIYKAIGEDPNNNNQNQKAENLAKTLCDELDRTCKTVPEYENGLNILGINLSSLGKKALNISPPNRLLQPDCVNHNDQQDLEADVEERKVQDEFGASEVCDVCGLPRTCNKMEGVDAIYDPESFTYKYLKEKHDPEKRLKEGRKLDDGYEHSEKFKNWIKDYTQELIAHCAAEAQNKHRVTRPDFS